MNPDADNATALYRPDDWFVKPAAPSDRDAIERIWHNNFDNPEDHVAILDQCQPDADLYEYTQAFVATDGTGSVIGFGIAALRNTDFFERHTTLGEQFLTGRDGYFYIVAVSEPWRQKGVATELFRRRLQWLQDRNANRAFGVAWQNPDGPSSDPLFQKFGFEQIRETPDDYYRGRDCSVCDGECDCTGIIYGRDL